MATRLHIGAKELKGELGAYAKRFDLLEVRGQDAATMRLAPSDATLRRWRKAVGPQFEFSVVSGPGLGKVKAGDVLETELAALLKTVTLLEARVIVLATASDVTPSKLWRDRLEKLIDRLPRDCEHRRLGAERPLGDGRRRGAGEEVGHRRGGRSRTRPMPPGPVAYGPHSAPPAERAPSPPPRSRRSRRPSVSAAMPTSSSRPRARSRRARSSARSFAPRRPARRAASAASSVPRVPASWSVTTNRKE